MFAARQEPASDAERHEAPAADTRMRDVVGTAGWARLPIAIRRRFSKTYAPGEQRVYRGEVVRTELSRVGWVLAMLARVVGAPLPLKDGASGPATVIVTEDPVTRHQCWIRCYGRAGRFTQVIQSAKRFQGPTGLEEYVGYGIGMSLSVFEQRGALVFRSTGYFLDVLGLRIAVPRLFEPGEMEITHAENGSTDRFSFRLTLRHRRLGLLVDQLAHFADDAETVMLPRAVHLHRVAGVG